MKHKINYIIFAIVDLKDKDNGILSWSNKF